MYLYELALELDERSADLALRAEALGVAGAGPTMRLTAEQVAALRADRADEAGMVPALDWVTGGTDLGGPAGGGGSRSLATAPAMAEPTKGRGRWFARGRR